MIDFTSDFDDIDSVEYKNEIIQLEKTAIVKGKKI
jgi:hypothetical protein